VLLDMGIAPERIGRWDRGVDLARFSPARRDERLLPGEITVLYAGRLTREKGADLLADAFLAAHERDPRLHLALAGGGPEEAMLHERLGERATFLGWLEGDELAAAYASADIFLFASRTDTFGQVLLEAQASGLPVVAVGEGGPTSIVSDGATGRLCPADAGALADVVCELAAQPLQRERLARTALDAVRDRTWERSLQRLADGYRRALDAGETAVGARRAA
jgi:glycosyltransferase involved in cell wall biosynthesis